MKAIFSGLALLAFTHSAHAGLQTSCQMPGGADVNVVLMEQADSSLIEVVYDQANTYSTAVKSVQNRKSVEVVQGVSLDVVKTNVIGEDDTLLELTSIGGQTGGRIVSQGKAVEFNKCVTSVIWER